MNNAVFNSFMPELPQRPSLKLMQTNNQGASSTGLMHQQSYEQKTLAALWHWPGVETETVRQLSTRTGGFKAGEGRQPQDLPRKENNPTDS